MILRQHIVFTVTILGLLVLNVAQGQIPNRLEPEYADAILSFNGKKYGRALKIIDELLKQSPGTVEFLELKALTLKTTKNIKKSASVYVKLIKKKRKEKAPIKEMAPYYFELGMIRYKQKKHDKAREYLGKSIEGDFNLLASHFFSGLAAFKSNENDAAEGHFTYVTRSQNPDFVPVAHIYLAQLAAKTNYVRGASHHYIRAKKEAVKIYKDPKSTAEQRKTAKRIYETAKKALEPLDKSRFYGTTTLLGSYDSNVLLFPSGTTASAGSGKSSPKANLAVEIGYASSPSESIQWIPSYSASFDYLFNRDSRTGEFYSNALSLLITKDPLAQTSYGLKVDSSLTFKRNTSSAGVDTVNAYLLQGGIGPYWKKSLSKRVTLNLEATVTLQKFYDDRNSADSSKRGGELYEISGSLQKDSGDRFWNPSATIDLSFDNTSGTEFRALTAGIDLNNRMYLNQLSLLTVGLDFEYAMYNQRTTGKRDDQKLSLEMNYTFRLSKKFNFLGTAEYTLNHSNITAQYKYNRFVVGAGISYRLF